jgi:subtilase family serine protease
MKKTSLRLLTVSFCALLVSSLTTAASAQDFVYHKKPLFVKVPQAAAVPAALPFCGTLSNNVPLICYSPGFLRKAYNFPSNLNGSGQTIVIVDAFGSPTIKHDLAVFDAVFGLPAPPSFQIVCPEGCPPFNPNDTHHDVIGWSIETSLDVEYAHAMAPGANIVLVAATTSSGDSINNAERTAIAMFPGSVFSQSFGQPEYLIHGDNAQMLQAHKNFVTATQNQITLLASAGDFGGSNGANFANAGFPASDPLVTAVGGTEGLPYPTGLNISGAYGGEQVWNENDPADGLVAATGGAPSLLFRVPAFQLGLGLTSRTIPDISYNAAINGGVLVFWSALGGNTVGFYIVGGTSAGSPQWAAIVALANQYSAAHGHGPLGSINPAIYHLAKSSAYSNDFHDITVGNNDLLGILPGFNAATGYDFATGWGTPNVSNLIPDLVNTVFP